MANYSDLTPSILPSVPGCPDITVERYLARVITDFFERTQAWQVNIVGGTSDSSFVVITSGVPVDTRLSACFELRYDDVSLDSATIQKMYRTYPDEVAGTPKLFVMRDDDELIVLPYPEGTATLGMFKGWGAVTPKLANTALPDIYFDKYEEALTFGTWARLMAIPQQSWTNAKLAAANLAVYESQLAGHKRMLRRKRHSASGTGHQLYGGLLG
tara:strand:+ start:8880 stop:9521 length:642 start_codon:yes stop_codon:yes gene_type:complete